MAILKNIQWMSDDRRTIISKFEMGKDHVNKGSALTVREGQANSHKDIGWAIFTDEIIKKLNMSVKPMVFILWGGNARSKKKYITNKNHLIIESAHPSPLSAYNGFFGSKPFSRANEFLMNNGITPINWNSVNE